MGFNWMTLCRDRAIIGAGWMRDDPGVLLAYNRDGLGWAWDLLRLCMSLR
jgi:hypothetical protein